MQHRDSIVLVGAGGVGSWFAIFLAMAGGVKHLHIFDDDTISTHNLNRLPYDADNIGRLKIDVLKEYIYKIRNDLTIYTYPFKFNPALITDKPHCIVTTVDTPEGYEKCNQYAKQTNTKIMRLACSHKSVTATTVIPTWNGGDTTTGYEGVQIWVYPTALVALLGVNALLGASEIDSIFNPNDLLTFMGKHE